MLDYSALASAVILKAYEDLVDVAYPYLWAKAARRREKEREDARGFLTQENPDLKFWCGVGGLNMKAIVEQTNRKLKETV